MTDWRFNLILGFIVTSFILTWLIPPIAQDPAYHLFADRRTFLGLPNFFDVISNLPFLAAGALGLRALSLHKQLLSHRAWQIFFTGVLLVSAGSAYYHYSPDNASLVWDRLPMTIGFMGVFIALLSEYPGKAIHSSWLALMVLFGIGTVVYWDFTDDLRFYAWVQFMPLCVAAILFILYRPRFSHSRMFILALAFYMAAKLTEYYDVLIYEVSGEIVSGHTLKHLLAAAGSYTLVLLLERRRALP